MLWVPLTTLPHNKTNPSIDEERIELSCPLLLSWWSGNTTICCLVSCFTLNGGLLRSWMIKGLKDWRFQKWNQGSRNSAISSTLQQFFQNFYISYINKDKINMTILNFLKSISIIYYYYICMGVFPEVCLFNMCVPSTWWSQKRVLNSLELDLQVVVSLH